MANSSPFSLEVSQSDIDELERRRQADTLNHVIATQRLEGIDVGAEELAIVARAVAKEITHEEAKRQLDGLMVK